MSTNAYVVVTQVQTEPNDCDLGAPLQIEISFDALRPFQNVQWRFSYARDLIGARNDVAELGKAEAADYAGIALRVVTYTTQLVGDAPNCGVLRCALHDAAGAELYRLDLVCQVTADEATGRLRRVVRSPLGDD